MLSREGFAIGEAIKSRRPVTSVETAILKFRRIGSLNNRYQYQNSYKGNHT